MDINPESLKQLDKTELAEIIQGLHSEIDRLKEITERDNLLLQESDKEVGKWKSKNNRLRRENDRLKAYANWVRTKTKS